MPWFGFFDLDINRSLMSCRREKSFGTSLKKTSDFFIYENATETNFFSVEWNDGH